jgi:hypothetical protein
MRSGLALPYMMGIDVISFSISMSLLFFVSFFRKKKKLGEKMRNFLIFFVDSFSDIACVFA